MTYECPECDDGGTIIQTIRQAEVVHTDEDGAPEQFEPIGGHDVLRQECDDCGHVLFDETGGRGRFDHEFFLGVYDDLKAEFGEADPEVSLTQVLDRVEAAMDEEVKSQ